MLEIQDQSISKRWFFLRIVRKDLFQVSPWLVKDHLFPVSLQFSFCKYLGVQISPLYKNSRGGKGEIMGT